MTGFVILCKTCAEQRQRAKKDLQEGMNAALMGMAAKRSAKCAECGYQRYARAVSNPTPST